ncbi:MAG TPA: hypothetical protein VIV58_17065 [Kofleriaceae bacterium]
MRWLLALGVLALAGCATGRACDHADETTYRCTPLVVGALGCVGGPRGTGASIYPIGCQVDVPECSVLDPAIPRTFECAIGASGSPDWYEPI